MVDKSSCTKEQISPVFPSSSIAFFLAVSSYLSIELMEDNFFITIFVYQDNVKKFTRVRGLKQSLYRNEFAMPNFLHFSKKYIV